MKIRLGEAIATMSYQTESDAVPTNGDIGMVGSIFCEYGNMVHKMNGLFEIGEFEYTADFAPFSMPMRHCGKQTNDFRFLET